MPGAAGERLAWVDCCKGICIILVVYGHVVGGLKAAGNLEQDTWFTWIRSWVYLFHMPAFFLLSGLFAPRGLERPLREFLRFRLASLAYPYVLWTGIYLAAQMAMARYANHPPDLFRALKFWYAPYGYGLWFLYSLFLVSLLLRLLALAQLPRLGLVLLAVALHLLAVWNLWGFWPILNTAMQHFVFYALGTVFAWEILTLRNADGAWVHFAVGTALLALLTLASMAQGISNHWFGFLISLCGIGGIVCVAKGLTLIRLHQGFSVLGFYSLEIYLGHAILGTVPRALLTRWHVESPAIHVACGLLVGLIASLLLAMLCRKFDFPYLFKWPQRKPTT